MSFIAAAVGSVVSSVVGGLGASSAANTQAGAAQAATAAQQGMFNTIQGNMQPYMQQGTASLGQLGSYLNANATGGPGGAPGLLHAFGAGDLSSNMAPNYQFQLGQGMGQTQNQFAAGGGGGNELAGLQSFAQNYAGNAYQNAFNNYNTGQNNIYSRLGTLAQLGQASGTNSALGGSAFAGGISNTITGMGNAQAAGQIGVANAITGGINNGVGAYTLGNMMNPSPGGSWTSNYNDWPTSLNANNLAPISGDTSSMTQIPQFLMGGP